MSAELLKGAPRRLSADGRPVMTKEQVTDLAKRLVGMSAADRATVMIWHTAQVFTRIANGQVLSGDDGDKVYVTVSTAFGEGDTAVAAEFATNQLEESALRALVRQCDTMARSQVATPESWFPDRRPAQDKYATVNLWHDDTVQAMSSARGTVVPELIGAVERAKLKAAGFLGLMARVNVIATKDGLIGSHEETDAELTVTARSADGRSTGWYGQAARSWSRIHPAEVADRAIEWARKAAEPVAVEPGRRTAILSPQAVAQIMRWMAPQFNAQDTDYGMTAFSRAPHGNKRGLRVFDPRVTLRSDPADPDGGYPPYFYNSAPYENPAMTWVEDGVLRNLAYSISYGMGRGKQYAELPYSMRMMGGTTSVDEMIAQCREGIYVNRFANVDVLDRQRCLVSGVTRDGCLLIKNGKVVKATKNFRFVDSPFFFLNSIEAIGPTQRAAFGYTPPARLEFQFDWPRPPMIVPAMMVRDFNFVGIADAV